jgi:hypothetical protein
MTSLPTLIQGHFSSMRGSQPNSGPLGDVETRLAGGSFTRADRHFILEKAGVSNDEQYRKAELDLVLSFIKATISTAGFGQEQRQSFELLKNIFEVREGEFLRFNRGELESLLLTQMETILQDDIIDPAEDEYQAALQDALDLGFDQYMGLCHHAFENAWRRLQDDLPREMHAERRADLERKLEALEPMIRLAETQQRTLGARSEQTAS